MAATLDGLLDQYDRGHINRRQLLKGLAIVTGGMIGGSSGAVEAQAPKGAPLAPAMSMNHVHIHVTDINRSAEYYATVLGAKPQSARGDDIKTMTFPAAHKGFGSWLSITKVAAGEKPNIDHVAYGVTVPQSEFPRIGAEVKKRYPGVKDPRVFKSASAGQELYIYDPDGIGIQIIQIQHNGELSPTRIIENNK